MAGAVIFMKYKDAIAGKHATKGRGRNNFPNYASHLGVLHISVYTFEIMAASTVVKF